MKNSSNTLARKFVVVAMGLAILTSCGTEDLQTDSEIKGGSALNNFNRFRPARLLTTDGTIHVADQGGPQKVSIAGWASMGTVVHEIGHAVGLIHEHTRPDRDKYIEVRRGNIKTDDDQLDEARSPVRRIVKLDTKTLLGTARKIC